MKTRDGEIMYGWVWPGIEGTTKLEPVRHIISVFESIEHGAFSSILLICYLLRSSSSKVVVLKAF